jgi:hypothetical protein
MIATKWKWNELEFNMKKFQNWNVGALVLWKVFGLTEISQTFWYENWQILMNEKSTSAGGIPDFFRVCVPGFQNKSVRLMNKKDFLRFYRWNSSAWLYNLGFVIPFLSWIAGVYPLTKTKN